MTVILVIALWMLGSARARTQALIDGETLENVEVVIANTGMVNELPDIVEIEIPPEPVVETRDIGELRQTADSAGESGAWYDLADALQAVTEHPDAGYDDFMALVDAQERIEDVDGSRATLNRICVRFPDRPDGYLRLGELYESLGNINAARFQYEVGLTYCPDNVLLREALDSANEALGVTDNEGLTSPVPEWIMPDFVEDSAAPDVSLEDIFGEATSVEPVDVEEVLNIQAEPEPASQTDQPRDTIIENSSSDESGVVTLIGSDSGPGDAETTDVTGEAATDASDGTESAVIVEIYDLRVETSPDQVTIELFTSNPAAIGTSRGSEPPRLFVRIPDARLVPGAGIARSISLNTDLVERINIVDNTENNLWVSLIVYLDQNTRHSVAADSRSIRVTITRSIPEEG